MRERKVEDSPPTPQSEVEHFSCRREEAQPDPHICRGWSSHPGGFCGNRDS